MLGWDDIQGVVHGDIDSIDDYLFSIYMLLIFTLNAHSYCHAHLYAPPKRPTLCKIHSPLSLFPPSSHSNLLPRPHIHNLQRRILQLNNMPRLQRLSIYIIRIMRMENARLTTTQNSLFTRWIGEAETSPTVIRSLAQLLARSLAPKHLRTSPHLPWLQKGQKSRMVRDIETRTKT